MPSHFLIFKGASDPDVVVFGVEFICFVDGCLCGAPIPVKIFLRKPSMPHTTPRSGSRLLARPIAFLARATPSSRVLTLNLLNQPRHDDVGNAYLEDITTLEFVEQGQLWLLIGRCCHQD